MLAVAMVAAIAAFLIIAVLLSWLVVLVGVAGWVVLVVGEVCVVAADAQGLIDAQDLECLNNPVPDHLSACGVLDGVVVRERQQALAELSCEVVRCLAGFPAGRLPADQTGVCLACDRLEDLECVVQDHRCLNGHLGFLSAVFDS